MQNSWASIIGFILVLVVFAVIFFVAIKFKVLKYNIMKNVASNTSSKSSGGIMPEDLGEMILGMCGAAQ